MALSTENSSRNVSVISGFYDKLNSSLGKRVCIKNAKSDNREAVRGNALKTIRWFSDRHLRLLHTVAFFSHETLPSGVARRTRDNVCTTFGRGAPTKFGRTTNMEKFRAISDNFRV